MGHDHPTGDCVECGAAYQAKRKDAEFCGSACGLEFNKRRHLRGMVLYDLMMINRNERKLAKTMKVWFLITRLCMYWRDEDKDERAGRRSWRKPSKVLEATNWARSTVVNRQ